MESYAAAPLWRVFISECTHYSIYALDASRGRGEMGVRAMRAHTVRPYKGNVSRRGELCSFALPIVGRGDPTRRVFLYPRGNGASGRRALRDNCTDIM